MLTMSTSTHKPYHHGDLKAALLDGADALLDEVGAGAISLREIARQTGVSATATYRHFADKEALLVALAVRGFESFGQVLIDAVQQSENPLAAIGQAYVRFALARPGRFRLMYGPIITNRTNYPELKTAQEAASQGFAKVLQSRTDLGNNPQIASLKLWCMVHGLSQLILDGMLSEYDPEMLVNALIAPNN